MLCTERHDASIIISLEHENSSFPEFISITANRGSIGISAIFHPTSLVRFPSISIAFRLYNNSIARTSDSSGGLVGNSKFIKLPTPKAYNLLIIKSVYCLMFDLHLKNDARKICSTYLWS